MSVALQKQNPRTRYRETQISDPISSPLSIPHPLTTPAPLQRRRQSGAAIRQAQRIALWKMGLFTGTLAFSLCAGFAYLCGPIRLQTEQARKIALQKQERQLYEDLKSLKFQKNAILSATSENAKLNSMVSMDAKDSVTLP